MTRRPPSTADLSAYADGELSGRRRREVARHLAADPESAAVVDAYRRQDELLKLGLKSLSVASDEDGLGSEKHRAGRPDRRRVLTAAAVAALSAGTGGWWLSQRQSLAHMAGQIAQQAVLAHLSYADAIDEEQAPTATAVARLAAVSGGRLVMPDLAQFGLHLTAVHEAAIRGNRGVVLRYAGSDGAAPVTCYFVPVSPWGESDFASMEVAGVGAVSRIDDGIGYAVVGRRPADELLRIAAAGFQYASDAPPGEESAGG